MDSRVAMNIEKRCALGLTIKDVDDGFSTGLLKSMWKT